MPSTRNSGPGLSVVAARYLEAIYYMAHEGEAVRPSRLAEWLGVRAPTVTGVVQRMRDRGYLVTAADHSLSLTDSGEEEAAEAVRRHRVVERWLADEVGLDWATADLEAGRIAHHFSSDLVSRLFKRLGKPTTCPHGNEIPGAGCPRRELRSLAELSPDVVAPIARISEVAEHEAPQLLRLLDQEGLHLEEMVGVQRSPGAGAITVVRDGRRTSLGLAAARVVWVDVSRGRREVRRGHATGAETPRTRPPGATPRF
ncbi:MAG: metal-dependent transcriptional regulator [Candidatus Dormibacteria bacterium]|jgi:DtxR family Mn-dependent transcriptional regulator